MVGTRSHSWTSLIMETWNVGWTSMNMGSLSLTAAGLMILTTSKGPMMQWANFFNYTLRGRSWVGEPNLLI